MLASWQLNGEKQVALVRTCASNPVFLGAAFRSRLPLFGLPLHPHSVHLGCLALHPTPPNPVVTFDLTRFSLRGTASGHCRRADHGGQRPRSCRG